MRKIVSVEEFRSTTIEAALNEGWRPALDDSEVFFTADPHGHFVGELDGKPISYISAVKYCDNFAFGGYYIVDKAYRGSGYGLAMFKHVQKILLESDKLNYGLNGVLELVPLYETYGFKRAWTNRRMEFDISYCVSQLESFTSPIDISVQPAKQVNQDLLSAYDTTVFGAPHDVFLKALLNAPNSLSFAATDQNGDVLGFVSVRRTIRENDGWKIGPLFADSTQIAKSLLKHVFGEVAKNLQKRKVVTMDVPYNLNPEANAVAKELNGTFVVDCIRMFTKEIPAFPKQKVFGVTTLVVG